MRESCQWYYILVTRIFGDKDFQQLVLLGVTSSLY